VTGDRTLALDGTLLCIAERPLQTRHGEFRAHVFRNLATGNLAIALTRGAVATPDPLISRVHSSCVTSEALGACDCDCAEQLDASLEAIVSQGRGVLFYLMQEGRGAGLTAKARDRMLVQASRERLSTFEAYDRLGLAKDQRRYDEVATMCRMLSIEAPLELLTNNPDKVILLEREKVRVSATRPLQRATSPFNRHYLQAKQRSGHALHGLEGEGTRAEWPEPVRWFEPAPLPGRPDIVYSASYWLPVRSDRESESLWFRLHLYYDLKSPAGVGAERIVLAYGPDPEASSYLLRVQPEYLFDRFPLRAPVARPSWRRTARALAESGGGCAVFLPLGFADSAAETLDSASASLLAEHAKGRASRLVCDALASPLDRAASQDLARLGVELGPAIRLTG
jgi:3,4-dihydroxy 2-butanone 4-phosphate synthase/GTP cyclohydrolase II